MPLRREINLQMITKKIVSERIANCIQRSFERLREFHTWSSRVWIEEINGIQEDCEQLKQYLLGHNPVVIQYIIIPIMYKTFLLLRNFCCTGHLYILDGAKYLDIRKTCRCILGSIFFPCLEELDLGMCDDFSLGLVIENLEMVSNIKYLWITKNVAPLSLVLEDKIAVLTNLRALYCDKCCTNRMLSSVAAFCQQLTLLDVENSIEVDDFSVDNIIRLQSLQRLDVSGTSISNLGYQEILMRLPELRNVCWITPIEQLIVDLPFERRSKYSFANVSIIAPATFCTNCPNISKLHIFSRGQDINVSFFSRLTELTDFEIKSFNFVASEIDSFLQQSGRNLKVLTLYLVNNVDCGAITNNCNILESLNFKRCEFMNNPLVDVEQTSPHFENLRCLCFSANRNGASFYECIQFYQHLLEFYVMSTPEIDDYFVTNLVENNVFVDLVDFFILTASLSYSTVDLLIDNCGKLKRIGDLNYWRLQNDEIQDLKAKVQNLNLDLEFVHIQFTL